MKRNIFFIDNMVMAFSLVIYIFGKIFYNHSIFLLNRMPDILIDSGDLFFLIISDIVVFYVIIKSIFGIIFFIRNIKKNVITFKLKYLIFMIPFIILSVYYLLLFYHNRLSYNIVYFIFGVFIFIGCLLWFFNWISLYNQTTSVENTSFYKGYEYLYAAILTLFINMIFDNIYSTVSLFSFF